MIDRIAWLRSQLPAISEGLTGALQTFTSDPQPDAAEILATRLHDAACHVLALGHELASTESAGIVPQGGQKGRENT